MLFLMLLPPCQGEGPIGPPWFQGPQLPGAGPPPMLFLMLLPPCQGEGPIGPPLFIMPPLAMGPGPMGPPRPLIQGPPRIGGPRGPPRMPRMGRLLLRPRLFWFPLKFPGFWLPALNFFIFLSSCFFP